MSALTHIMNKWKCRLLQLSSAMIAVVALSTAWAGQSATMTCTSRDIEGVCLGYELRVFISSDVDTGRLGAFGIGVQLADGQMGFWTVASGFSPYRSGLIQPVEGIVPSLPASREYLIFTGTPSELCALAAGQAFDVYAGHGTVPPEQQAQLDFLLSRNIKLSNDHIRGAYLQQDVRKNPWKSGLIYSSQQCGTPGS